jgi:hypothetical protein
MKMKKGEGTIMNLIGKKKRNHFSQGSSDKNQIRFNN